MIVSARKINHKRKYLLHFLILSALLTYLQGNKEINILYTY